MKRLVFVKTLDLPGKASGYLKIAVDDYAEVRVNGTRIGSTGSVEDIHVAWAAQSSLATFDLTPYLVPGKNTIAITAQNGPASYADCGGECTYATNPAGIVFGGDITVCAKPGGDCAPSSSAAPGDGGGSRGEPACTSAASAFIHGPGRSPALGAWSFGWSAHLGTPFTTYTMSRNVLPGLADSQGLTWLTPNQATHPGAFFNPTNAVRYPGGTFSIEPGQLALHPGPKGEVSIARWSATETGRVTVEAEFFGLSGGAARLAAAKPTTTDVHLLHGADELAKGSLNLEGAGNTARFRATVEVAPGDVIDFAVGQGNGAYEYDSTALDAVICTTPAPASGPSDAGPL
jgi:hypothetical protein